MLTKRPITELCEKFDVDWERTPLSFVLNDLGLPDMEEVFVTGGSLVRLLMGLPATNGDIDIYTTKSFPDSFNNKLKKSVKQVGSFATTYKYKIGAKLFHLNVVDKMKPLSVGGTLNRFDLSHCQFALVKEHIFYTDDALLSLVTRKQCLNPRGFIRFKSTAHRIIKYNRLGFNGDQAMKDLLIKHCSAESVKDSESSWEDAKKTASFDVGALEDFTTPFPLTGEVEAVSGVYEKYISKYKEEDLMNAAIAKKLSSMGAKSVTFAPDPEGKSE